MKLQVDYDITELAGEIFCDALDILLEVFDEDAVEDEIERFCYGEDIDDCAEIIDSHYEDIVESLVRKRSKPLSQSELHKIGLTEEECEKADIPFEPKPVLKDEQGRVYEMVDEDSRQMTLFDETGLPPMKVRKYVNQKEGV